MFANTFENLYYEYMGKSLKITFTYRDEDDMPTHYWVICRKDQIVSNCNSVELIREVYYDVTACRVNIHSKTFSIGYKYFYRIMEE